jgi:salicylate hydroxylase
MLCLTETPEDFYKFNFGYDVVRDSKQAMERSNPGWELPSTFFEKEPEAGVYP